MKERTAALLVFGVAVVSQAWIFGVPFKFDDLEQIANAPVLLKEDFGVQERAGFGPPPTSRFRPLLWAMLGVERQIYPQPYRPFPFQLTSLLLFGFAALTVHEILKRLFPSPAALAGALYFGIQVAGSEALSWITSRGDLLIELFVALAILVLIRRRSERVLPTALIAGLLLGLAAATKFTAIVFIPVVLLVHVLRARWSVDSVRGAAAILLPAVCVSIWQMKICGGTGFSWGSGAAVDSAAAGNLWDALPQVLMHLTAPWREGSLHDAAAPLAHRLLLSIAPDPRFAAGATLWALLLIFVSFARASWRPVCVAAIGILCGVFPMALVFKTSGHDGVERAYATVAPFFAAIVAGAAAGGLSLLRRAPRAGRLAVLVALASVLASAADSWVHVVRTEWAVAHWSRRQAELVEEAAVAADPGTTILILGSEVGDHGAASMNYFVPFYFRPPFRSSALRVAFDRSRASFAASSRLREDRSPLRVIEDDGRLGHLVWPPIPAIPAELPPLVPAGVEGAWAPAFSIPPRGAAGVKALLGTGSRPGCDLVVAIDGKEHSEPLARPARATAAEEVFPLPATLEALAGARLEWLAFRSDGINLPLACPPTLEKRVPEIEVVAPDNGLTWGLGDPIWYFKFRPREEAQLFRLEIEVLGTGGAAARIVYDFPRDATTAGDDGLLAYWPREEDRVHQKEKDLSLVDIPRYVAEFLRPYGIDKVTLRWTVGTPLTDSAATSARSKPRTLIYRDRR